MRLPGQGLVALALTLPVLAAAEPYLAVRAGQDCSGCHVNPTGGGLRTVYGNLYAQTELAAQPLAGESPWTGRLLDRFGVGSNARVSATDPDNEAREDSLEFGVDRVALYLSAEVNEHVLLYVDQQVAPNGSLNREAWVKLSGERVYLKAGQLYLPFGWRLEDDGAFTRQVTGINFATPDDGIEVGFVDNGWTAALAVSNGNGGAGEVDDGKFFTFRGSRVSARYQLGFSAGHNDTDRVDRLLFGVFAGLNTGPLTWLAEWDHLRDEIPGGSNVDQDVGLIEVNARVKKGHNLKLTAEHWEPDENRDRQRYSVVWEYSPWPFSQLRVGGRLIDGNEAAADEESGFVQLHVFF